jgi:protoheme ferro-lyase
MPGICLDCKSFFPEDCSNAAVKRAEIIPIQPIPPVAVQKIDIKKIMNYTFQEDLESFDAKVMQKLNDNKKYIEAMTRAVDAQLQQAQKQLEALQNIFSKL